MPELRSCITLYKWGYYWKYLWDGPFNCLPTRKSVSLLCDRILWQSVPSLISHFIWSAPNEGKSQTAGPNSIWAALVLLGVCTWTTSMNEHSSTVSSFIVTPCMSKAFRPCSVVVFILIQNRKACLLFLTSAWKMTSEISDVYYSNTSFCSRTTLGEMVVIANDFL